MRIAVVTSLGRMAGGIETYLSRVIPKLLDREHDVALWFEYDAPQSRQAIPVPRETSTWCCSTTGATAAIEGLRAWKPDVVYAHGMADTQLESELMKLAPVVFFAHQYFGTCISGAKTWKFPRTIPCDQTFGWRCLAHYYPHRCGGLNPATMWRMYCQQRRRLSTLGATMTIATHSEHLRHEYIRNGVPSKHVHKIPFPVEGTDLRVCSERSRSVLSDTPSKLLFLGRMDRLKGGLKLLEAAPVVAKALGRHLQITFAGDGPDRAAWERAAVRLRSGQHLVTTKFVGWVEPSERSLLFTESDLLVVPSLWPEPFGMVGIEAGHAGLPSVAFDVGGIYEWLKD